MTINEARKKGVAKKWVCSGFFRNFFQSKSNFRVYANQEAHVGMKFGLRTDKTAPHTILNT